MTDPRPDTPPPTLRGLESEYEIVSELGRGGTAVVYLAVERELGRAVAIKVIRAAFAEDDDAVARLVREARTLARLQHPNIVMLHGTRRLADGGLALVMQYIRGPTLRERIRTEGPLQVNEAMRILRDVARGLAYAHRRRIVHRDIKPENIYLDAEVGLARISDFGIARAWDSDASLTVSGLAIGTPAYMSPEQIDGSDLDGRSDLYSLGVVGWEMLSGRRPWEGETLYNIIYKQKHERLPPLAEVRPDLPAALREAVETALEKDPDRRWPTADAFLRRLTGEVYLVPNDRPPDRSPSPDQGPSPRPAPAPDKVSEDARTIRYRRPSGAAAGAPAAGVPADGGAADGGAAAGAAPATPPGDAAAGAAGAGEIAAAGAESVGAEAAGAGAVGTAAARRRAAAAERREPEPERREPERRRSPVKMLLGIAGLGAAAAYFFLLPRLVPKPEGSTIGEAVPGVYTPPVGAVSRRPASTVAGTASRVVALGDTALEATVASTLEDSVAVRVEDEAGRAVVGAPVRFAVTEGGGSVAPRLTVTDSAGVARAAWTLGPRLVPNVLAASLETVEGVEARFHAAVVGGAPARLAVVAGGGQQGAPGTQLGEPVVLRVEDRNGVPVRDATVRIQVLTGDGAVPSPTLRSDARGLVRVPWTLGPREEANVLLASIEGVSGGQVQFEARAAAPRFTIQAGLATGGNHTCLLDERGQSFCWGANARGQLGEAGADWQQRPVGVAGGVRFATVSAGVSHTCGVSATGVGYCWGSNASGQLGDGSIDSRNAPVAVGTDLRLTTVAAGLSHTCGLAVGGAAYCWGSNESGQLGDGGRRGRGVPGAVAGSLRFRALAAGWAYTCGLTIDGAAYCWGQNAHGQLGDGGTTQRQVPVPVAGDHRFTTIATGSAHACGVDTGGRILCWGRNTYGQLGSGDSADRTRPAPVALGERFVQVSAGSVHSCGLTAGGTAYCWGRNTYGQLGDGTTQDRTAPVPVAGQLRFASVQTSGAHTCGATTAGDHYCWGFNADGQLGDGTRTNQSRPVRVRRR